MKFCALSEKGKRENNEDYYLAEKIKNYYVFAVADGLGGQSWRSRGRFTERTSL